jgi:hypothetical protein
MAGLTKAQKLEMRSTLLDWYCHGKTVAQMQHLLRQEYGIERSQRSIYRDLRADYRRIHAARDVALDVEAAAAEQALIMRECWELVYRLTERGEYTTTLPRLLGTISLASWRKAKILGLRRPRVEPESVHVTLDLEGMMHRASERRQALVPPPDDADCDEDEGVGCYPPASPENTTPYP